MVNFLVRARLLVLIGISAVVAACGGGGGGGNTDGTNVPAATNGSTAPAIPAGPNIFLLFPNPQRQADGSDQTNTAEYASAYYRAIDPSAQRTTLEKWKTVNGFYAGSFK